MSTQPKLLKVQPFTVTGLTVRTKNENEFNPQSAKLPQLWQQFHCNDYLNQRANLPIYAVYSDYQSDVNDCYSVTVGKDIAVDINQTELENIRVEAGDYLVFTNTGDFPQAIIELWQTIWHYFESGSKYKRAYRTDFEAYLGADQCSVYIGV